MACDTIFYCNFKFLFFSFLLYYVLTFNNPSIPTPHPYSITRSYGHTLEKTINIDIWIILKIKFQILSLCILLLYWIIDPEIFFVRFIPFNTCTNTLCKDLNRKNLICMNYLLPLSIFFFF